MIVTMDRYSEEQTLREMEMCFKYGREGQLLFYVEHGGDRACLRDARCSFVPLVLYEDPKTGEIQRLFEFLIQKLGLVKAEEVFGLHNEQLPTEYFRKIFKLGGLAARKRLVRDGYTSLANSSLQNFRFICGQMWPAKRRKK